VYVILVLLWSWGQHELLPGIQIRLVLNDRYTYILKVFIPQLGFFTIETFCLMDQLALEETLHGVIGRAIHFRFCDDIAGIFACLATFVFQQTRWRTVGVICCFRFSFVGRFMKSHYKGAKEFLSIMLKVAFKSWIKFPVMNLKSQLIIVRIAIKYYV
jgi:hypothetical protein